MSLQEYMSFMISRETENVSSRDEIEKAFKALSSEGKLFVTKQELYAVRIQIFQALLYTATILYITIIYLLHYTTLQYYIIL